MLSKEELRREASALALQLRAKFGIRKVDAAYVAILAAGELASAAGCDINRSVESFRAALVTTTAEDVYRLISVCAEEMRRENEDAGDAEMAEEEIRRLLEISRAATPDWFQATHVGEPRAICGRGDFRRSLLALDRDGMAVFGREEDAACAVAARNALPVVLSCLLCAAAREIELEKTIGELRARLDADR